MSTWNPALYRSWFAVAQSRRLKEKPLSVTLLDRVLVIARLNSGELLALDDCCPHRHVPLSTGRVTAEGLQCRYHGWTFDADGKCTALPGLMQQSCKPVVRVGSAKIVEHDGLIWVKADASGTEHSPGPSYIPVQIASREPPIYMEYDVERAPC